ncbi:Hypothetical predicted protein, partial [Mytilus galloprovincialis]
STVLNSCLGVYNNWLVQNLKSQSLNFDINRQINRKSLQHEHPVYLSVKQDNL